jgi:hypothetical protein
MKKIVLSVLLSVLVVGSSQCTSDVATNSSFIPTCVSNFSGDVVESMKNHYYIWASTGFVVTGIAALVLYDVLKNDKKLFEKSKEYAQKFFKKTFQEHPYATMVVIAGSLLTFDSSYDYFFRGEDSIINSIFASKNKDKEKVEKKNEKNDRIGF